MDQNNMANSVTMTTAVTTAVVMVFHKPEPAMQRKMFYESGVMLVTMTTSHDSHN